MNMREIGNMRQFAFCLAAAGFAFLCASSCTNLEATEPDETVQVKVRAYSGTQDPTKTSISGTSVLWSENDQIAFFSSGGGKGILSLTSGAGTTSATFEGTVQGSVAPFFGFYPAANGISKAGGSVNFSLPQVQTGKEGGIAEGANPSLAVFPTLDSDAEFYNLSGLLRLTLKGDQTIWRIKLVSLNPAEQLWGNVAAAINTNKEVSEWTLNYSGGDNVLYLDFPSGLTLSQEGKTVFFSVPTGTLSSGFKVVVYDKYQTAVDEFLTYTDYTIGRASIRPMAPIQIGNFNVLDAEESANCYNVCKTNTALPFKFCAVKGNSFEALTADTAVEYWESQTTSPSEFNGGNLGYLLTNVGLSKHCVTFTLQGRAGSASIAAKSGEDILWSWHIWITNSLPSCAKMANGTRIMDTNLGAVGPGTGSTQPMGLLYQWGRKDPFPAPYHVNYNTMMCFQPAGAISYEVKSDASLDYTVSHPGTFIDVTTKWEAGANTSVWAADKTIYDPCPPGYRVPTKAEMTGLSLGNWDASYYRYTESLTDYHFNASSRSYYSSGGTHVNETAHTGYYWTCDHANGNLAQLVTFSSSKAGTIGGGSKSIGAAVRCVAEVSAQPTPSAKTVKVSLIGDSISTFSGYINSGNLAYYPRAVEQRAAADIEVVDVKQTYWWQLIYIYMSNAVLEKSDAWSGSCMGGYDNTCMVSRYTQERVGNPDVIIINAGTNDLVRENHYLIEGVPMSEEDTVHPTDAEMEEIFAKAEADYTTLSESLFVESYVKILHKIRADLPNVQFLLIIGDRFSQAERKAIISIAERYDAHYVDFLALGRNCLEKQSYVHPSIRGMATMSKYIYDCQGEWLESLGNNAGGGTSPAPGVDPSPVPGSGADEVKNILAALPEGTKVSAVTGNQVAFSNGANLTLDSSVFTMDTAVAGGNWHVDGTATGVASTPGNYLLHMPRKVLFHFADGSEKSFDKEIDWGMVVEKQNNKLFIWMGHENSNHWIRHIFNYRYKAYTGGTTYPDYYDNWGLGKPAVCTWNGGTSFTTGQELFLGGEAEAAMQTYDVQAAPKKTYSGGVLHGWENIYTEGGDRLISFTVDGVAVDETEALSRRAASKVEIVQKTKIARAYSPEGLENAYADVLKHWVIENGTVTISVEYTFLQETEIFQGKFGMFCVKRLETAGDTGSTYITRLVWKDSTPSTMYEVTEGWESAVPASAPLKSRDNSATRVEEYGDAGVSFAMQFDGGTLKSGGGFNIGTNGNNYNKIYFDICGGYTAAQNEKLSSSVHWELDFVADHDKF